MKLLAFRVRDFRSVDDTGWIDVEQVTALIGTNEAGKTNVLTPLWKLNPARDGEIDAIRDYPRKRYNVIREMARKPIFIDARFELPGPTVKTIARQLRVSTEQVREAVVSRDFDGTYFVRFRRPGDAHGVSRAAIVDELNAVRLEVSAVTANDDEQALKNSVETALRSATALVAGSTHPDIEGSELVELEATLAAVDLADAPKFSAFTGRFGQLLMMVTGLSTMLPDAERRAARQVVVEQLPTFVYYSNFGNLDAQIYLPHVIENLNRADLGSKEAAKARTLKMLFDFVKLSPEEILALGREVPSYPAPLTAAQEAEIATVANQKKEREILLQSAATDLTRRFKAWWKQGNYTFRFQADGDHFRIWVSDAKRPEPIELESRSTGLQFFLSFYLVFLAESQGEHKRALLLLDEPGLSLHPLAQADLSAFFDGLAETNQLVYTTHSPFMVASDRLGRTCSVYSDNNGVTQVTAALEAPSDQTDRSRSMYVSYASVAIATAEALMLGSQPVIVGSAADQHYLIAIRNYLIQHGHLRPGRDILFMAGGGIKGTRALAGLVRGRDEPPPYVVLASTAEGRQLAFALREGMYADLANRLLAVGTFHQVVDAGVEDLFPPRFMAKVLDRYFRKPSGVEEDFVDVVTDTESFVSQAEAYAARNSIPLDEGWTVDFARRVKMAMQKAKQDVLKDEPAYLEAWRALFAALQQP